MIDDFLSFESKEKLFDIQINQVFFWEIIRFDLYHEITNPKDNSAYKKKGKSIVSNLLNSYKNNSRLKINKKDIIILNHPRRVLDEGYYKCLYTSNLVNEIEDKYLMMEIPYEGGHYTPAQEKSIFYTDNLSNGYYFKKIKNKLFNTSFILDDDKRKILCLIRSINRHFSVNLNENIWLEKVTNVILYSEMLYPFYLKIIEETKPKVIIQVVSYLSSRFIVNRVAKEKGIPIIELQHGTMGLYHIAYNFAPEVNLHYFPDYVFTFGEFWKQNTRLPITPENIISVGWPYFEKKVTSYSKQNKKKDVKIVLFISQGTVGKELSKFACELQISDSKHQYEIIYKLHPSEYQNWRNNYPWLIGTKITVVEDNNNDMHYYFRKADIQIGVGSTALFEGLGYGLKTYIIKLYGHKHLESLYNNNYAILIESLTDFFLYEKQNIQHENLDLDYIWEKNSLDNMLNQINEIMNK